MRTVEALPRGVRTQDTVFIPLADGTRIAATVWLPDDAEADPVPAVVEMVPYRRRWGTIDRDAAMHPYVAGHGYACVRVDIRGSGESGGLLADEYLAREIDDAVEIIHWLAAQPWCTGAVGMTGISWGGFNSLAVAARNPEPLKAVIALGCSDDRYADDVHYMGGCMLTENPLWSAFMLALNALPPDPQVVGADWRAVWRERLAANRPWGETWIAHQRRDDYWKHASVCEDPGAITCAVYAVNGFDDGYSNAVPRLLERLSCPRKGLVGPWSHVYPFAGDPGPHIGYLQEALRWWDHWLKGIDTGIMDEPMYRAWLYEPDVPKPAYPVHPGRWVAEDTWPSPRIVPLTLHPDGKGLVKAAPAPADLTFRSPVHAGMECGRWAGYGGDAPDMPLDQRAEDGMGLCFDTAPLDADLELLGAPQAELELAGDAPAANVTVRLCDVAPDGTSLLLTWGVLNLCRRHGHDRTEPMEPGRFETVTVRLNDLARRVPAGHRLRLAVASHHWPIVWPQPVDATLTLRTGISRLLLPVRPPRAADADLAPFGEPEGTPGPACEERRAERHARTLEKDGATGARTLTLTSDFGDHVYTELGVAASTKSVERFHIRRGDPLSAAVDAEWTLRFASSDADVTIVAETALTGDAETFRLTGRCRAFEGEACVDDRDWDVTLPRDGQ